MKEVPWSGWGLGLVAVAGILGTATEGCQSLVGIDANPAAVAFATDGGTGLDASSQDRTQVPDGAAISQAAVGPPKSCADEIETGARCGSNGESCCASPLVPGGAFLRDYDPSNPQEKYPATVSNFRLDKFEVTVGRFRKFANAWVEGWRPKTGDGKHSHLNGGRGLNVPSGGYEEGWEGSWSSSVPPTRIEWERSFSDVSGKFGNCQGWNTWTDQPGLHEALPINCVSWFEAYAFCIWDGGFLPSDAELNFAAAGGSDQRHYPWSDPPSSDFVDPSYASYGGMGDGDARATFQDIFPVGAKPKGNARWGHADLGGNLAEWTLDWYSESYVLPCVDCANIFMGDGRVVRGGDFDSPVAWAKNDESWKSAADKKAKNVRLIGFRCSRAP